MDKLRDQVMGKLRGITTAQCGIAVKAAKMGAPEVVTAMETGTAVGLIIALRIVAQLIGDGESRKLANALIEATKLHDLVVITVESITKEANKIPKSKIPKDVQDAAGFEVNHD